MSLLRTERGLDRLVNFSDAAVAIAITLLILPLADVAPEIDHMSLGALLGKNWQTILALVISFAVIANLWVVHHQLFELVADYNYGMVWLNMLWLFSIIVLPFATNILSNAGGDDRAVDALYLGTVVVSSGSMLLIRVLLAGTPELMRPERVGQLQLLRSVVPTGILSVAFVLAMISPQIGIYWLFLLLLSDPLDRVIARLQSARSIASS